MKIVISLLNFQLGRLGGGETYLRGLIDELPGLCRNDRVVLLAHRDNAEGSSFQASSGWSSIWAAGRLWPSGPWRP